MSHVPCIIQLSARPAVASTLCRTSSSHSVQSVHAHIVSASRKCTVASSASCFLWAVIRNASTPNASARNACAQVPASAAKRVMQPNGLLSPECAVQWTVAAF